MQYMGIGMKRTLLAGALLSLSVFVTPSLVPHAQGTSSRPADLVNNDKVIYSLPDVGSITPENPLFVLKQLRDNLLLAIPQSTPDKIKLLIQMGDKYTVYADKLSHLSKSQRSLQMFNTAMSYQSEIIDMFQKEYAGADTETRKALDNLRNIAIQSNIKQAETIRALLDAVPPSEQPHLVKLLDENIQLRKELQSI